MTGVHSAMMDGRFSASQSTTSRDAPLDERSSAIASAMGIMWRPWSGTTASWPASPIPSRFTPVVATPIAAHVISGTLMDAGPTDTVLHEM